MPWLEVPEWRAWESYTALMPDTPIEHDPDLEAGNTPLPGDGLVITGTIDIRLEGGDTMPPFPSDAVEDVPWPTDTDDTTDDSELVGPEPMHEPPPFRQYETPPLVTHEPPAEDPERREQRLAKESMSRSQRLRNGW